MLRNQRLIECFMLFAVIGLLPDEGTNLRLKFWVFTCFSNFGRRE
jgi:hypothetical protein